MNKLLLTSLDSKFYVYDLRTFNSKSGYAHMAESVRVFLPMTSTITRCQAHKSTIWCGRHLPQNRDVFMTSGGNGSLSLWKYHYPAQRAAKGEGDENVGVVRQMPSITT